MNVLLIDDIRHVPVATKVARTFQEGIDALQSQKWDILLLDHDLGEEKSGYDVMCWLEQNPDHLPGEIACVSANPVGKARIEQVIRKLYAN